MITTTATSLLTYTFEYEDTSMPKGTYTVLASSETAAYAELLNSLKRIYGAASKPSRMALLRATPL